MARQLKTVATAVDRTVRKRELVLEEQQEAKARELAKKNADFVQFTRKGMREYSQLIERSAGAARLLVLMAEKMDYTNALVVSSKTLEELTGMSRATVTRAIAVLRDEQWVQIIKVGTANAYFINSGVFWSSYGDRKHASFQATILATSSEQDPETMKGIELKRMPFLRKKDGERGLVGSDQLPPPDQQDLDLQ
jgi:hypothetical protein